MQLSDRIRATAAINKRIADLAKQSVFVFYGNYVASGLRPRYDGDEGHWYTKGNQKPEALQASIVIVSDSPAATMSRRADDKYSVPDLDAINSIVGHKPTIEGSDDINSTPNFDEEEIPF
jgi:hypothetical protein